MKSKVILKDILSVVNSQFDHVFITINKIMFARKDITDELLQCPITEVSVDGDSVVIGIKKK